MEIIFYNDDYGLTHGFTDAIIDCATKGITTTSCVRVNGAAYAYAKKRLTTKVRKVVTGIHFNLTDGKPLNPRLADRQDNFKYSFGHYVLFLTPALKKEIQKEFELQLTKARSDGFIIDHANSQEHVHMIPEIFSIAASVCKKHHISKIRLVNEPFYTKPASFINLIKFLILNFFTFKNKNTLRKYKLSPTADYFYGVLRTDNMNLQSVIAAVQDGLARQAQKIEILAHPAYFDKRDKNYTSRNIKSYVKTRNRKIETLTYLDIPHSIRKKIQKIKVTF